MRSITRQAMIKRLQSIFWVYLTKNFIITNIGDVKPNKPATNCLFVPITFDNYFRVGDFREQNRITEYRDKLLQKELGCFVEHEGKMVASIWATINQKPVLTIVRTYMRLMPNEALIHDIVTGENFRGMGVGPFMVGRMASILLDEYRVSRIIVDVNVRNGSSLRMMNKAGLKVQQQVLYVSAFGRLVLEKAWGP
jgi:hypothetical protein